MSTYPGDSAEDARHGGQVADLALPGCHHDPRNCWTVSRIQDLVLAVHEAMANVVVHTCGGRTGTLDLHAWHDDSRITVTVTDQDVGNPSRFPDCCTAVDYH